MQTDTICYSEMSDSVDQEFQSILLVDDSFVLRDRLALAFEELAVFTDRFEILGTYPADPFRSR